MLGQIDPSFVDETLIRVTKLDLCITAVPSNDNIDYNSGFVN